MTQDTEEVNTYKVEVLFRARVFEPEGDFSTYELRGEEWMADRLELVQWFDTEVEATSNLRAHIEADREAEELCGMLQGVLADLSEEVEVRYYSDDIRVTKQEPDGQETDSA